MGVPAPKLLFYSSPSIRSALVTKILISIKHFLFSKIRNSAHSLHINATLNNISVMSWRFVLLLDETRVPGENSQPVQTTDKVYHKYSIKRNIHAVVCFKQQQMSYLSYYDLLHLDP